jgi:hypothetical protein
MCADFGLKTSATAGTIFHRSHTPLSTWFAAIWFATAGALIGLGGAVGALGRVMVKPAFRQSFLTFQNGMAPTSLSLPFTSRLPGHLGGLHAAASRRLVGV